MRLLLAALAVVAIAAPAWAEPLRVNLDQSTRVRLASPARDVVIGNPAIADVTMLDSHNLTIVGKAFGATHLLVIDTAGRTIVDRQLLVTSPDTGQVSMVRGPAQPGAKVLMQSYICGASCEQSALSAK